MVKNKISIIIPVYNGESFLRETLRRILESIEESIQVIIIDDGSTDGSKKIYTQIAKNDKRVECFYKENGGIVSARNMGLEKAKGEYICFCDQDDIVFSKTYSAMIFNLEKNKADVCICSTGRWMEGEIVPYELLDYKVYKSKDIENKLILPMLMNGFNIPNEDNEHYFYSHIWKCMVKRDIFEKYNLRFKKFINYEDDLIMLFDILCVSNKIITIPDILYCWRVNFSSESYRKTYIEQLDVKQRQLMKYFYCKMRNLSFSSEMLKYYLRVQSCKFYIDRICNETSLKNKKKFKEKMQYLNNSIMNKKALRNYSVRTELKPGQFKQKITLFLLSKHLLYLSYAFIAFYNWVNKVALKSKFIILLERKLKHIT